MVATTETGKPHARIVLPGRESRPASLEVIYLPRATRIWRALLITAVALVAAPVVFFLPPDGLWSLVVLGAGAALAYRYWTGSYYVVGFEGTCPQCGTELELAQRTRIQARHGLECNSCHAASELVMDEPD